ncbi:MAG: hypothetical protein J0L81_00900 [Caulobacterales bacterium]|jgi:hypothetical protein|nr:hypothetical protein [Caulobacterales bacterium]
MSIVPLRLAAIAVGAMLSATAAHAQSASNTGDVIVDARLRYESVSQDGLADADALTFRARLGYETSAWRGFRALGEIEGVAQLAGDFNDTVNGHTAYAVIADPEAFELNRLQLSWSGAEGRRAVLGRQRIVLNNARFIGNVGFRQNEQTFDALRLEARPFEHAGFTYAYIGNVRRVFGDDSAQGEWESDSHVLQADFDLPIGKANLYGLWLDFGSDAPAQSNATYGVRWSNEWTTGAWRPRLTLEAATQSEYGANTADFDLGYQHAELSVRRDRWTVAVAGERLEGNDTRGFTTPLATLHAFQGWADVFLNTPADGVRDLNASVSYATQPWRGGQPITFTVRAHDFTDDAGGTDFGGELDASVRFGLTENLFVEAKGAVFEGEDPRFADRNKFWLALEYRL